MCDAPVVVGLEHQQSCPVLSPGTPGATSFKHHTMGRGQKPKQPQAPGPAAMQGV